jgi:hypothetical protein
MYTGIHFGHHQLKEEFAEGVIRIRKSKDRQHNVHKKKDLYLFLFPDIF